MNIYFSYNQLKHNPPREYFEGQLEPHPEIPERAQKVLDFLMHDVRFKMVEPKEGDWSAYFLGVHDPMYMAILKEVSESFTSPGVYFLRDANEDSLQGKYTRDLMGISYDSITPVGYGTWESAYWSALTALNAAAAVRRGNEKIVFGLTRPPGHHAGRNFLGGYCYLNNAALAAEFLAQNGSVAILDFDYHHGNGTESIFYERRKILYVSLHGAPPAVYPYFSGNTQATGKGRGKGYNINIPLTPKCGQHMYEKAFEKALHHIKDFSPRYLVVSAGFDIFTGDVEDSFELPLDYSGKMGRRISSLKIPTVVLLEGGYNTKTLPELVYTFLMELIRSTR